MKLPIIPTAFLSSIAMTSGSNASLIITGTFDGGLSGGLPKVIELYVTAPIADLSLFGVGAANNGGGSDGVELIMAGSATAGQYIYVVDGGSGGGTTAADTFAGYFGFAPSLLFDGNFGTGGAASINGDDAVELFSDPTGAFGGAETVIDVFGDINTDGSGQAWDYLDGWAYRNDNTGPGGSTFTVGDWSFSGINVTDGAATAADVTPAFPVGTYSQIPEPSSALLGGLALLGLLGRRRA